MLIQGVKSSLRQLSRERHFAVINLIGLAVGMGASFLLLFYVLNERDHDRKLPFAQRSYRVLSHTLDTQETYGQTPYKTAFALTEEFPAVERAIRFTPVPLIAEKNDERLSLSSWAVDAEGLDFLGLDLTAGSVKNWQSQPDAVLLEEGEALRLFGTEEVLGRTLEVSMQDRPVLLTVAGVYKALPESHSLRPRCITHMDLNFRYWRGFFPPSIPDPAQGWTLPVYTTFVILHRDANAGDFERQLLDYQPVEGHRFQYKLQSVTNMYLHSSHLVNNRLAAGDPRNILFFSVIAALILIIACVNYVLLSMAQTLRRIKAFSILKVIGATRWQVVGQIIGQSTMMAVAALPFAFIVVELGLPLVNRLLGVQLAWSLMSDGRYVAAFIGLTLLVGVASGLYLAVYHTRVAPAAALRACENLKKNRSPLRTGLVLFQMVAFILLIGISLNVDRQIKLWMQHDPGFDTESLFVLPLAGPAEYKAYGMLKQELASITGVEWVSGAGHMPPDDGHGSNLYEPVHMPGTKVEVETISLDKNCLTNLGVKVLHGRLPDEALMTAESRLAIVNEAMLPYLDRPDGVGSLFGDMRVVAVVSDMQWHSLKSPVRPMVMSYDDQHFRGLLVGLNPALHQETEDAIAGLWAKVFPKRPFRGDFYQRRLYQQYADESRFQLMLRTFSVLAVFVAGLGLFGLSLFMGEQRSKEMSIRRVLGASNSRIISITLSSFALLVAVATVLSAPLIQGVVWLWLRNFPQHQSPSWWLTLAAGGLGLLVTALTLAYQAVQSIRANPADTLRYE